MKRHVGMFWLVIGLVVFPATAALGSLPTESGVNQGTNCEQVFYQTHQMRVCRYGEVTTGNPGTVDTSGAVETRSTQFTSADAWPDAEHLWIAALVGAVAGTGVALLRRRQPPMVS